MGTYQQGAKDVQASQTGGTSANSGGHAAGVAAHNAKMKKQAQLLKTAGGRTTGGMATSSPTPMTDALPGGGR